MKEQWQLPILILHDGRIVSIVAVPRVLNPHDKYYTVRVSGFRQLFWGGDRPKLAGGSRWRRRPPTRTPDPLRSLKLSFKPAQADGPPRRTTGSPRPRAAGEPPARRALRTIAASFRLAWRCDPVVISGAFGLPLRPSVRPTERAKCWPRTDPQSTVFPVQPCRR